MLAQPGAQEVPSEHQAALLGWAGMEPGKKGSPKVSLGISRSLLDMVMGSLLVVALLEQGWDQVASRGPFSPQPSCGSGKSRGPKNEPSPRDG